MMAMKMTIMGVSNSPLSSNKIDPECESFKQLLLDEDKALIAARFKNGVFWVPVDEPMPTGKR